MAGVAAQLAWWAYDLEPSAADLELARRSLLDTVAVALAGRDHPVAGPAKVLSEGARWAAVGHVLDFDDLHMESTTHVSVVCVPAVLATGGGPRAYLAAAGVMARLGSVLGWGHYASGWHATCTAGAPAAAVGASIAMGLAPSQIATAIALALPGAGGVQRAFGTDAKSLQVGFAVETGLRAARLAAAGADADLGAVEAWLALVGGSSRALDLSGDAVPGGLAIKIYPCCYALQRPISALAGFDTGHVPIADIARVVVRTPEATLTPLIHHRPATGLQAKFSIEYAVATALLDSHQGFASFTDAAVQRPEARRLLEAVELEAVPGGNWLLDGELRATIHTGDGRTFQVSQQYPPGSPQRPPSEADLNLKLADCLAGLDTDPNTWTWASVPELLRTVL